MNIQCMHAGCVVYLGSTMMCDWPEIQSGGFIVHCYSHAYYAYQTAAITAHSH